MIMTASAQPMNIGAFESMGKGSKGKDNGNNEGGKRCSECQKLRTQGAHEAQLLEQAWWFGESRRHENI